MKVVLLRNTSPPVLPNQYIYADTKPSYALHTVCQLRKPHDPRVYIALHVDQLAMNSLRACEDWEHWSLVRQWHSDTICTLYS